MNPVSVLCLECILGRFLIALSDHDRAPRASLPPLAATLARGGRTRPASAGRVAPGDQQVREAEQHRDALRVLRQAPVAHLVKDGDCSMHTFNSSSATTSCCGRRVAQFRRTRLVLPKMKVGICARPNVGLPALLTPYGLQTTSSLSRFSMHGSCDLPK